MATSGCAKQVLLAPNEGTLLHFLKSRYPAWADDIAKVIDPQLLLRGDLEPALVEPHPGLYGLALNLQRCRAHPASTISHAEQAVAQAEQGVADSQIAVTAARERLEQLGKQREQAEQVLQQHEQDRQRIVLQQQNAQSELESAKQQLAGHKTQAEQQAAKQLAQVQQQLQQAQAGLKAFDDKTRDEERQRRSHYQQQRQQQQDKRQQELTQIQQQIAEHKQQLQQQLIQLDQERDQALAEQGVDTDKLKQIDGEIQQAQHELTAMDGFTSLVEQWRYWRDTEWPKYPHYQAKAEQARALEQQYQQRLNILQNDWQQRDQQLKAARDASKKQLSELQAQQLEVEVQLTQLPLAADVELPGYDASWRFELLVAQKVQLSAAMDKLTKQQTVRLKHIGKGFRQYIGTPPEQYYQNAILALSEGPHRRWIKPIKQWFDYEHQEYKRVL